MIKRSKTNIWSIIHNIVLQSSKISMSLTNYYVILCTRDFKKRFNRLKIVNPQTNNNKVLKQKVLDDVRDLFNELCYIYKDKYKEEKYGLNARGKKKKKKLTAKNWHLLMIINMNLKKKNNRLVKKNHPENLMKKNHLKNQHNMIWENLMNGIVKKKQT